MAFSKAARSAGATRFLQQLEQRYGDMSALVGPASVGRVLKVDSLSAGALEDLFAHRVCAIRVPNFISRPHAAALADHFLEGRGPGLSPMNWKVPSARGMESTDVESIGMPYNMVVGGAIGNVDGSDDDDDTDAKGAGGDSSSALLEAARDDYFRKARELVGGLRGPEGPGDGGGLLTPIDKLRLELDDVWPEGAMVAKDKKGRAHLAGAGRIMRPSGRWREGFIHVDELDVLRAHRGLFSANVYLRMPPSGPAGVGGQLHIWNVNVRSRWDFLRNAYTLARLLVQREEDQALLRQAMPAPLAITPDVGELVLICAQRPHAACGAFDEGVRVSMQAFVSHEEGQPLRVDA